MSQLSTLIEALKQALKGKGITYRQIGEALDLSEASIKRMFAEEALTLKRLETICQMADMGIADLIRLSSEHQQAITRCTLQQERELAADPRLLLLLYLLLNEWTYDAILEHYTLAPAETTALLLQLERLKLIQLHPKNRVKLLVSRALEWQADGPVRRFFLQHIRAEFLNSNFSGHGEELKFLSAMLTPESKALLSRKLEQLVADFDAMVKMEAKLPLHLRSGCSLMLAFRPWQFSIFEGYRRHPEQPIAKNPSGNLFAGLMRD